MSANTQEFATVGGLPCGIRVIGRRYGDHDMAAVSALFSGAAGDAVEPSRFGERGP